MSSAAAEGAPGAVAVQTDSPEPLAGRGPKSNTLKGIDDEFVELSEQAAKMGLGGAKDRTDKAKDKQARATSEMVLDPSTRMILFNMINNDIVSEVHGAISTGKEANVYGAVRYPPDGGPPQQKAIKVYKTAILVFKDRERYIKGERRFKGGLEKGNARKMIKLWAEKEFRNLQRLCAAGIPCPEPIKLKRNVLVMTFLGDKRGWAYPRLRDAVLTGEDVEEQWRSLYIQLLGMMRRLYRVCRLVHADLSEYNILYNDKKLYIIDVSQSVEPEHPYALEFLRMDIKNVGDFFRKQGVDTLQDRTMFEFITDSTGPAEEPALTEAIENLYKVRKPVDEKDEAALEWENQLFRQEFIPRTLEEVYDIEKDAQKLDAGMGEDLVYRSLLSDQVVLSNVLSKEGENEEPSESSDSEEGSEDGASLGGSDDDSEVDQSIFEKGRPRGRKFDDKEEKRQHKQAVKEAKREKRLEKMPKAVKKKIVLATKRR